MDLNVSSKFQIQARIKHHPGKILREGFIYSFVRNISEKGDKKDEDFEIRKKDDSIQKKRQYRSNKDDSSSDSDHGKSKKVVQHISL